MKVTSSMKSLCLAVLLVFAPCAGFAQGFEFQSPASVDDAGLPALMRDLAERVLPVYENPDPERFLENLAVLQLVSGAYAAAVDTQTSLRERREEEGDAQTVPYRIYARARAMAARENLPFAETYARTFREVVTRLSDREAYAVIRAIGGSPPASREALQRALERVRTRGRLSLPEAVNLIWIWLAFDAQRSAGSLIPALEAEDDARRYTMEDKLRIRTRGGVELAARLVRPKNIAGPLPALLEFTIHVGKDEASAAAAHGYVGVVAYTRGKLTRRGRITPFEHDGEDARAVIEWIAKQPWSDGRVGMLGSRYSGFAAWAAARRAPAALKAIATMDPMAPGIDFPTDGQVLRTSAHRWAAENTSGTQAVAIDPAQWRALDERWYESGRRSRDLDRMSTGKKRDPAQLAATPNRVLRRWLGHPSYDRYWQKMIPFREQFAKIEIPVLTTSGYYADGAAGALHYFREHHRYNQAADHALLVGPWDDDKPSAFLKGYALDTAAQIDLRELRYQWFDRIFRNGARPALLKDRVNYELMGENLWRHAPSLDAMSNTALRFYLESAGDADRHRLTQTVPPPASFVAQIVDFADRSDVKQVHHSDVLTKKLAPAHALIFVSNPLPQATEFSGLLSGVLDFHINKFDVDLNIALYEQLPGGAYLLLSDPHEFRASYARDRVHRKLLKPGLRQQLKFTSESLMGRQVRAGSRVVLVLGINKRPDREINYGAGNDVRAESIGNAKLPMKLRWYGGSFIEIPVRVAK